MTITLCANFELCILKLFCLLFLFDLKSLRDQYYNIQTTVFKLIICILFNTIMFYLKHKLFKLII